MMKNSYILSKNVLSAILCVSASLRLTFCLVPWLFLFLFSSALMAADIKVEAAIDRGAYEQQPLNGMITITHRQQDKVDIASFKMGKKTLKVEQSQETPMSSGTNPLVITFYRFKIEGQPKGLHLLPPISVHIGGKEYQTIESTYEVGELSVNKSVSPSAATPGKSNAILKLDLVIEGPAQLYPGQRIKVIYRYTFNDNIELTKETLPLLEGTGFLKIGAKDIQSTNQEAYSLLTVSQVLEAVQPGEFKYDPSIIEGFVYRSDTFGGRIYLKPKLSAEVPARVITVNPFPKEGQPASFNGAVGPFNRFDVYLKSSDHINVGDKVVLQLDISGTGQLENAPMPALCCQPGYSGVFSLSDLPPFENLAGGVKSFTVELRALTADVKEIPPIEFSYFIPDTKKYGVLRSQAIPITITQLPVKPPSQQPAKKEEGTTGEWRQKPSAPGPIEISSIERLKPSDLVDYVFGSWWVYLLIPLGVAALVMQLFLRKYWREHPPAERVLTGRDYFDEAMRSGVKAPQFFQLLNRAFILRLQEKGYIASADMSPENLPTKGIPGEVRAFLVGIEEKRFTGEEEAINAVLIGKAKDLFYKI